METVFLLDFSSSVVCEVKGYEWWTREYSNLLDLCQHQNAHILITSVLRKNLDHFRIIRGLKGNIVQNRQVSLFQGEETGRTLIILKTWVEKKYGIYPNDTDGYRIQNMFTMFQNTFLQKRFCHLLGPTSKHEEGKRSLGINTVSIFFK